MHDWPDIAAALQLRASLTVPDAGVFALSRAPDAQARPIDTLAVQDCLRDALVRAETVIWTTDTLLGLASVTMPEVLGLTLIPESVAGGMRTQTELWLGDRSCLVSEGDGEGFVIDGMLLVRHGPVADPLPPEDGVLVAALVHAIPQLVFWWPVGTTLAEVVTCGRSRPLALPLLAVGHWVSMGLAARACGALATLAAEVPEGAALVVLPPRVPSGTVRH